MSVSTPVFRRILVLVMFLLAIPGLIPATASAQDADLCDAALGVEIGTVLDGYEVVSLTGGVGRQIVLGSDRDDYLEGAAATMCYAGLGAMTCSKVGRVMICW